MERLHFFSRNEYLEPYGLPVRLMIHHQVRAMPHNHDFHELVIVLEGSGKHCTEEKYYPISAGDVFVIKPGMLHFYQDSYNLTLANVMFDSTVIKTKLLDLQEIPGYFALFEAEPELRSRNDFKAKLTLNAEQLAQVRDILNIIEVECRRRSPGYRFAVLTAFHQLLLYVTRSYDNDEKKYSQRMIKLSMMIKFIEENFTRDISRKEIMNHAGVSTSVGSRIFQEFLHETLVNHLIKVRIKHASELLRNTDLPISEIAFRCGFRDSNYFSLQFKKQTGYSPRQFARQQE